jgi:RHS repeat-associated protein
MYYYLRNGQNDIIGILNSSGVQVVSYVYDSWGNPISTTGTLASTIGADNPFRYRGYYFDFDTGLYYLSSRYYDSTVGRFINADGLINASSTLLGTNMYGYCENNPIMNFDPSGRSKNWVSDLINGGKKLINDIDHWLYNTSYSYKPLSGNTYSISTTANYFGNSLSISANSAVRIEENAISLDFSSSENKDYGSAFWSNQTGTIAEAALEIHNNVYKNSFGRPASIKDSDLVLGLCSGLKLEMNAHWFAYVVTKPIKSWYLADKIYNSAYEANLGKMDRIWNGWRYDK